MMEKGRAIARPFVLGWTRSCPPARNNDRMKKAAPGFPDTALSANA
jgi:hypothetical protein